MMNDFKIAWRSLLKNKAFSCVNILGLAIGMAGALLIALWLQNMLTMDRFHEKSDRLYIMSNRDDVEGERYAWSQTPKIMGPTIQQDYPEVESFTRYSEGYNFLTTFEEKKLKSNAAIIDPGFFNMFSFPIINGHRKQLLQDANVAVITEKFAKAIFGEQDPIGKIIKIDSVNFVTIQAVIKSLPTNTAMRFDMLLSWEYAKKINYYDENWSNNSIETFILLKPNASLSDFNEKVRLITQKHTNINGSTLKHTNDVFAFPVADRFLYDNGKGGDFSSGRIQLVRLFSWIGFFILLVACINYMNLSTARSEKRAKEVAVRKVVGAGKTQLIIQFIAESVLVSLFALLLAILLVVICLPSFNLLVHKQLNLSLLNLNTWFLLLAFATGTGILAGIYPAFFLSAFKPLTSLKGLFNRRKNGLNMRSVLVVLQFSLAIILIISTVIVTQQIQHTKDRDRGYDDNGLIFCEIIGDINKNYEKIRLELLESGAAISVTKTLSPITARYSNSWAFTWPESTEEDKRVSFSRFSADAGLLKTMSMTLVSGRDIDIYTYPTDSTAMILTESAVNKMRLKDPLGAIINENGSDWTVVGVVKDFILESPFQAIDPLVIEGAGSYFSTMHYRLNPLHNTADNLKTVEHIFKKYNPDYPFEYTFADKSYANKFRETQSVATLSKLFAGLTIFISCLGLLALIAYIAELRTKEIAVRKVLGASIVQISSMLSTGFIKLIVIAILLASPIAWWVMNNWLQDYQYRIEIRWYYFATAGVIAIFISLLTISFQALKAARANPVDSLRDE